MRKIFSGWNFEHGATAFTMPIACPRCGSMHTRPVMISDVLGPGLGNVMYKSIWESMDNNPKNNETNG